MDPGPGRIVDFEGAPFGWGHGRKGGGRANTSVRPASRLSVYGESNLEEQQHWGGGGNRTKAGSLLGKGGLFLTQVKQIFCCFSFAPSLFVLLFCFLFWFCFVLFCFHDLNTNWEQSIFSAFAAIFPTYSHSRS